MPKQGLFRVGTSGWAYPEWKKKFYPEEAKSAGKLNYYAGVFDCLEVNSTFYRMHRPGTFKKWADTTPDNFQFTFKMWRDVTHVPGFEINPAFIDEFMQAIVNIGTKRAPLLIQLPPKLTAKNIGGLETILRQVVHNDPNNLWPIAVEFRNVQWYTDEVMALLDLYQASLVLHDMPKSAIWTLNDEAPFAYFRFHGLKGDYKGSYDDAFLHCKAAQIAPLLKKGKDVYAYFNNTMDGDAPYNALKLRELVGELNG